MGQNVGAGQKMMKNQKRGTKVKNVYPKWLIFVTFFPSNRGKWRDQAFIEGQMPPI